MDPELRNLMEETHALAKDNHRMLRTIRRGQVLSFLSTVIIWVAVLALPLYLYQHYFQPLITSTEIGKLLNSFKVGQ